MHMRAMHAEWTVDMLDALPDDLQRYELIDGVLHVTPAPSLAHQVAVGAIHARLYEYLKGHRGIALALVSPSDVRRGDRTRNHVQPDVFVVRLAEGQRPEYPFALDAIVLAIEVVSPGNPLLDYQVKRDLYLRGGVGEYWVVNLDARNVARWKGSEDPGELLSDRIEWGVRKGVEPLTIDLGALFEEALG
jgi:Uma2 family endonuclease